MHVPSQNNQAGRRLQELRDALSLSLEECAVGFNCGYQTVKNYEGGYRGSGGAFRRNLHRYCEWLAEEAVRRGKPHLALSSEELAPDVFGEPRQVTGDGEQVTADPIPVAAGPRPEEEEE